MPRAVERRYGRTRILASACLCQCFDPRCRGGAAIGGRVSPVRDDVGGAHRQPAGTVGDLDVEGSARGNEDSRLAQQGHAVEPTAQSRGFDDAGGRVGNHIVASPHTQQLTGIDEGLECPLRHPLRAKVRRRQDAVGRAPVRGSRLSWHAGSQLCRARRRGRVRRERESMPPPQAWGGPARMPGSAPGRR